MSVKLYRIENLYHYSYHINCIGIGTDCTGLLYSITYTIILSRIHIIVQDCDSKCLCILCNFSW